jgi:hypothetical protein
MHPEQIAHPGPKSKGNNYTGKRRLASDFFALARGHRYPGMTPNGRSAYKSFNINDLLSFEDFPRWGRPIPHSWSVDHAFPRQRADAPRN